MTKARLWTLNFTIITLINFAMFFAFQLFPSALPPYLKSLGADNNLIGLQQGVLTIATLIARPFAGIALDKYGRKGIFIIGIICMLISTAAYLFFPVVAIILAIRFAHGIAWGIANTACSTIASDNIEKHQFALGMGYFSLASSIAMAIAPAVALSLDIHNNIYIALAFLIITLILFMLMKVNNNVEVEQTNVETQEKSPYVKESILPSIIMALITITWGAIVTFLALYAAQRSIANIGIFFTIYAISMLVTRPALGKLIDEKGYDIGVYIGIILVPIALIILGLSQNILLFLFVAVIYGIGMGAIQSSLQTMAIVLAPKARTGAANATFFTGFDGGIGLGAVIAGLISSAVGYANMFMILAIFPILAGIIYFVIDKNRKRTIE